MKYRDDRQDIHPIVCLNDNQFCAFLQKSALFISAFFIALTLLMAQATRIEQTGGAETPENVAIFFLVAGLAYMGIRRYRACAEQINCQKLSNRYVIIVLVLAVILPRIYLLSHLKMAQISDYATYFQWAEWIFRNESISEEAALYSAAIAGTAPWITKLMTIPFYFFGVTVESVLIFNVILYTISTVALYFIGKRILPDILAAIVALFYALWPNHVYSSLYILSEPLYLAGISVGILLFLCALDVQKRTSLSLALIGASGVLMCMAQNIRPVAIIFVITIIIISVLSFDFKQIRNQEKQHLKQFAMAAVFFVCIAATSFGISQYTKRYLPVVSEPSYGWTLYEGTNPYTWGGWSQQTAETLQRVMHEYPIEEIQPQLLEEAKKQLKTYDLEGIIELFRRKAANQWGLNNGYIGDLSYVFYYDPAQILSGELPFAIQVLGTLAQPMYLTMVLGIVIYMIKIMWKVITKRTSEVLPALVITLPLCGGMMLHYFATAIQRYSYVWIPVMILLLFCGMKRNAGNNNLERSEEKLV